MIDPRYLVRLDTLPRVSGAPVAYLCTECGAAWTGEPTCSTYDPDTATVVECLDLSAPPERDGVPVRLDALPWALIVLGRRFGMAIDDIDAIRAMDRIGVQTWDVRAFGGRCVPIRTPKDDGWEDYDPADPNQPRRIVAAALREVRS